MLRSPLQPTWDLTIHLPWRSSGSDIIYNDPSPPLADIVLFGLPLKVFKTRLLGRGFYTFRRNVSFPSPTNVGSLYDTEVMQVAEVRDWVKVADLMVL